MHVPAYMMVRVLFVGKVSEGMRLNGRSTSAQNRPFSAIPRNSVTRICPPAPPANITLMTANDYSNRMYNLKGTQ